MMTVYRFRAARQDGHAVRGTVEAASRDAATAVLSSRGLYALLVEPASVRTPGQGWRRPGVRATATVMRGLATLVDAGVPMERALKATQEMAAGELRAALARCGTRVREGSALSAALAAEAGLFSGITVGLIRSGEGGIGLGQALLEAADQLEREAETVAGIRAALAYPTLLAVVGSLSVAFIMVAVVPRFAAILGDLGQALPPATRVLIRLSDAVHRVGIGLLVLVGALASLAAQAVRRHRRAWHETLLRVPLLGPLRHSFATARAARTLGALLGTGTPALAAVAIARDATGDEAVAARLDRVRERVAEGEGLAAALAATAALTPVAAQLAMVGEGGGRLPALLRQAANLEGQVATTRLRALIGLMEPLLIVAFAGVVAFVAAALLQAIYSVRPA